MCALLVMKQPPSSFESQNNQVDIVKKGSTLKLYKAKINIMNDSMELIVPAHGNIQVQQESATFTVKEDNNMSTIRYEVVEVEV